MQRIANEIRSLGGSVYFIGPETEKDALQFMEKTSATIPLLYDLDGTVMKAYRLAFELPAAIQQEYLPLGHNLPEINPGTGWTLPITATFVVDQTQTVRARYVNADYTYRMEPSDVLRALREIQSAS